MSGLVAIVGRPNVGKSALFNRIVGKRIAIVHEHPGVTRDRITSEAGWKGRAFTLVDTGGIGLDQGQNPNDVIQEAALDQAQLAIDAANVIVFVTDVQAGVTPLDRTVADRLRASGKPVIVAVNKVDNAAIEPEIADFAELGLEEILPVSAIHGRGVTALLDTVLEHLAGLRDGLPDPGETVPKGLESEDVESGNVSGPLRLAVIGRPNVGKSSIVNALTKSKRVIVSPVPGTTHDAIDVPFEVEIDRTRERYVLIDTAGIRKTRRIDTSIEFFSVKRAERSIDRCDIALFVLDAEAGILEQDKKIADRIIEARKACVLVVNKWDLVDAGLREARATKSKRQGAKQNSLTFRDFGHWLQEKLFFLDYAPVIFVSAKTGFSLDRVLGAVRHVAGQLRQKVPTAFLNRVLHEAIERRQPVSSKGQRLKFFYATQVRQAPPTFVLFVNHRELFAAPYAKFLQDELRSAFGYEGCPVVLEARSRPRRGEPGR